MAYSILKSQPAFGGVAPYNGQVAYGMPTDVLGVFAASQSLSIRQHVKLLPKACCSCPPCVKQENTYSVYAGLSRTDAYEFLRVDEVSDDWNRCCCPPNHPFKLEVRQYIPAPGTVANSDWDHLYGDLGNDWGRFTGPEKQKALRDFYKNQPVLFTIERDDGMRCSWCCPKYPCKCLNVCICCDCCADGVHVYSGAVKEREGAELGRRHPSNQYGPLIGSAKQPFLGGGCKPTIDLRNGPDGGGPFARIRGPCIFGGWSELCCDFKFFVSRFGSPDNTGDVALIMKRKPSSMAMIVTDLMSDADNYTIEFDPSNPLTPGDKATILAAQVLADYMYFDGNTEKCKYDSDGITCYFWYCSILGCLTPCCIHIPNNKS